MIFIDTEHSLFFLLLLSESKSTPIIVVVENSLVDTPPVTYSTHVMSGGILLGAMKTLMDSNANFK